jgi:pimeloyl-ACP methyl ester carboxylesterase
MMNDVRQSEIRWLERLGKPSLAYCRTEGSAPGLVFLGGFGSDMAGTKASALEAAARARGRGFLRFDYRGHGASEGACAEATLGDWLDDALAVFDSLTAGPQIVIGSSMGGWIALLLAERRPGRVLALVGVAAAPDFTERLIWRTLPDSARDKLLRDGVLYAPSDYGPPQAITLKLIEEGRTHLLLDRQIAFAGPARLLHGQRDQDVPWELSLETAARLASDDARVTLVKDGDHRLSRAQDIALLIETIDGLLE